MKNTHFRILIFAVVALAISLTSCKDSKRTYSQAMKKVFYINVVNELVIDIPESTTCEMLHFIKTQDSVEYLKGEYKDNDERGSVFLDYRMFAVSKLENINSCSFAMAPFIVSNQGSGNFYYLGLFMKDFKSQKIKHIDSRLLGDRITIDSMATKKDLIEIFFKERSSTQAMTDKPSVKKHFSFRFNKEGFTDIKNPLPVK